MSKQPHQEHPHLAERRKALPPPPCAAARARAASGLRGGIEVGQIGLDKPKRVMHTARKQAQSASSGRGDAVREPADVPHREGSVEMPMARQPAAGSN